jgi:hypothetical protein
MDFDTIRPVISGLIGATIAGWLAVKWAGRLPHAKSSSKQSSIVDKQRTILRCANIGAGLGIGAGLVLYFGGFLDRHDWRGLGLAAGLMALLPLVVIVVGNLRGGMDSIKNGLLAYAIAQKTPVVLLFPLMALMVAGGVLAAIAFLPKNPNAEQAGTGQPATRPESKSEGSQKPQPEVEGRSR